MKTKVGIVILLCIACILATGCMSSASSTATPTADQTPSAIVTSFHIDPANYIATAEIKNPGKYESTFEMVVDYYDSRGVKIGSGYLIFPSAQPGETVQAKDVAPLYTKEYRNMHVGETIGGKMYKIYFSYNGVVTA